MPISTSLKLFMKHFMFLVPSLLFNPSASSVFKFFLLPTTNSISNVHCTNRIFYLNNTSTLVNICFIVSLWHHNNLLSTPKTLILNLIVKQKRSKKKTSKEETLFLMGNVFLFLKLSSMC